MNIYITTRSAMKSTSRPSFVPLDCGRRRSGRDTMQCNLTMRIRYDKIRCQHNTIRHDTIQYGTIRYDTIRYNTSKKKYNAIKYNAIKCRCVRTLPTGIAEHGGPGSSVANMSFDSELLRRSMVHVGRPTGR